MEDTVKLSVGYLTKTNELSKINEVILSGDNSGLIHLKSKVAETFGIPQDSFRIFFGTKCLECLPDCNVKDIGLATGMKLYAIEKSKVAPAEESSSPEYEVVRNAMYGLSTMFAHSRRSRQRNNTAIYKFIDDKKAMDAIIASVAGLENDRIALDIVENHKLLEGMMDPKNTKKVIDNHPCLAIAFVKMWNSLMSNTDKYSNFQPVATTSSASSSEESMDVDSAGSQPVPVVSPSVFRTITSSELASALAETLYPRGGNANASSSTRDRNTNVSSRVGAAGASTSNSNQRRNNPPLVTPEAMQQALMSTGFQQVSESVMSDSVSGASPTSVSEDAIKSGLEQLQAMGITDEAVCRQALITTQGNVEEAINIIFSGS